MTLIQLFPYVFLNNISNIYIDLLPSYMQEMSVESILQPYIKGA